MRLRNGGIFDIVVSMNFFSKLWKKPPTSVLGIDIGSSSIKVVELKRDKEKALLQTYGELSLGPYAHTEIGRATSLPAVDVGKALSDLLIECKAVSRASGVAIPFGSSLVSMIELPAASQKDLATIVPIEARKYIPVPISEVVLDWSVIPSTQSVPQRNTTPIENDPRKDKIDVMTVAIHNDTIARFKDIVQTAGVQADFFEIEVFSTMRAIIDTDPIPVLLMDMGAASTKLYIIERGVVKYAHTVNKGSQDLTLALSSALSITVEQAELLKRGMVPPKGQEGTVMSEIFKTSLDVVFSEANRVMMNYQKKFSKTIARAYVVGGGAKLKGFLEDARTGLEVDVLPGDPFSKVETPAFMQSMLNVTGPEFTVAVGAALRRLSEM